MIPEYKRCKCCLEINMSINDKRRFCEKCINKRKRDYINIQNKGEEYYFEKFEKYIIIDVRYFP